MTDDMKDVDHTHPHDDQSAGRLFRRGPAVAADGGKRDARDEPTERMEDVDHEPPGDNPGTRRVFERGREGKSDDVREE